MNTNKNDKNEKNEKNNITNVSKTSLPINSMISLFKKVNPSYQRLYSNKTQRSAVERLLKTYGQETLTAMINSLEITNRERFAPTVTTPLQLEDKVGALKAFYDSRKAKKTLSIDLTK